MAQDKAVKPPKLRGEGARGKASRYDYNQGRNQGTIPKFSRCFAKSLKIKSRWRLLGFCLVFQYEMMFQEDPIELEKKKKNKKMNKIKN